MVITSTLAAKALLVAGTLLAAGEAPAAASGDQGSLYVAVSGVLVALISATAVVITSRNKPQPPAAPFMVDDSFTDELTGLYQGAEQRAARAELRAEMWKARAIQLGWDEPT